MARDGRACPCEGLDGRLAYIAFGSGQDVRIRRGVSSDKDGEKEAALHSGFAEILPEGVIILAEIIEWPNEIDENRAKAALHRAEERLRSKTPETDIARAETALQRAMARIQVLR